MCVGLTDFSLALYPVLCPMPAASACLERIDLVPRDIDSTNGVNAWPSFVELTETTGKVGRSLSMLEAPYSNSPSTQTLFTSQPSRAAAITMPIRIQSISASSSSRESGAGTRRIAMFDLKIEGERLR